ncbi:hypothetical protein HDV00_003045 [Rhizophlyctis rosea]|nr:hypothetical protein HDV00_003045 [Rhizophlyctis rosea]
MHFWNLHTTSYRRQDPQNGDRERLWNSLQDIEKQKDRKPFDVLATTGLDGLLRQMNLSISDFQMEEDRWESVERVRFILDLKERPGVKRAISRILRYGSSMTLEDAWNVISLTGKDAAEVHPYVYTAILRNFLLSSDPSLHQSFLHRMDELAVPWTEGTVILLMLHYLRNGAPEKAVKVYQKAIARQVPEKPFVKVLLLSAHLRNGNTSAADEVLKTLESSDTRAGDSVLVNMFHFYIRVKAFDDAHALLTTHPASFKPLDWAILMLLRARLSNRETCVESCKQLMDEMVRFGLTREMCNFQAMAEAYLRRDDVEMATDVLTEAHNFGLQYDVWVYNMFIRYFCRAGQIEDAERFFVEADNKGAALNSATYYPLLNEFAYRRMRKKAEGMFDEFWESGTMTEEWHFKGILKMFAAVGDVEGIRRVVDRVSKAGVELDKREWEAVERRFSRDSEIADVLKLLDGPFANKTRY